MRIVNAIIKYRDLNETIYIGLILTKCHKRSSLDRKCHVNNTATTTTLMFIFNIVVEGCKHRSVDLPGVASYYQSKTFFDGIESDVILNTAGTVHPPRPPDEWGCHTAPQTSTVQRLHG